jgi:hypothetical protein
MRAPIFTPVVLPMACRLLDRAVALLSEAKSIMQLVLVRFDLMIGTLRKQIEKGNSTTEIIARLIRLHWLRDDLTSRSDGAGCARHHLVRVCERRS